MLLQPELDRMRVIKSHGKTAILHMKVKKIQEQEKIQRNDKKQMGEKEEEEKTFEQFLANISQ